MDQLQLGCIEIVLYCDWVGIQDCVVNGCQQFQGCRSAPFWRDHCLWPFLMLLSILQGLVGVIIGPRPLYRGYNTCQTRRRGLVRWNSRRMVWWPENPKRKQACRNPTRPTDRVYYTSVSLNNHHTFKQNSCKLHCKTNTLWILEGFNTVTRHDDYFNAAVLCRHRVTQPSGSNLCMLFKGLTSRPKKSS